MVNWIFSGKEILDIQDFEEDVIGFVYVLEFSSGKKYIGRKYLFKEETKPMLLSGEKRTAIKYKGYISSFIKPRLKKEVVRSESDWKQYTGSSKLINEDDTVIKKEILFQCRDKNAVSYAEELMLFVNQAIFSDIYYNKSIQGRHFDNAIHGLIPCKELNKNTYGETNDGN